MNGVPIINFIKYTMVGTLGLVLDMTTLYLLVEYAHFPVLIATALAFMVAIVNNFILHKFWTFRDKSKHIKRQFTAFFVISVFNFIITIGCMYIFYDLLHIWYMFAKFITAIIVLIFSYIANRIFTFKKINMKTKKA